MLHKRPLLKALIQPKPSAPNVGKGLRSITLLLLPACKRQADSLTAPAWLGTTVSMCQADTLATSVAGIYALGDCIAINGRVIPFPDQYDMLLLRLAVLQHCLRLRA